MHISVHIVPGGSVPTLATATHRSGWQVVMGAQSASLTHASSESSGAFTAPSGKLPLVGVSEEALESAEALEALPVTTTGTPDPVVPSPPPLGGGPWRGQAMGASETTTYAARNFQLPKRGLRRGFIGR
jgi:hypothetical protein